ncbi:MAG: cyclic nucleotide-binding domain-containing protein, partial [Fimbriimonadales bacterium]
MLTTEELAAIPLFATLQGSDLKDLGRGSADIHLRAGDYLVHEGDEAALFVVLAGNIHVTKLIDGIERKVGERLPGKILGEIPLIYGTQFQSSGRASEPSRVLRVEARQYYA